MSLSFWHRFPKRDYEEIRNNLKQLIQLDSFFVSPIEKKQVESLLISLEKGFELKEDLKLDIIFLRTCLEYYLLNFPETEALEAKETLKKIKRFLFQGHGT